MNNLPLKIFYTLKEASAILNERLKSTEFNEEYFLHLGMKGDIRLGVFAKPNFEESDIGVLYSDWFEFDDSEALENLKAINSTAMTLNEIGAILILNNGSIKDIYFNKSIKLKNTYFDNTYSIDTQEFSVKGDLEETFSCCKFFDKLRVLDFFDVVFYSEKYNTIHNSGMRSEYLTFPKVEDEKEDDWKVAYWFREDFDVNRDMSEFQSEREICRDDFLILGEDIELILNGQKRELPVKHPRKRLNKAAYSELDIKTHPKRANSINQVIYGLAKMADLDLSQHQSAYTQLEAFCNSNGIEIPGKDTCGNLFREAHRKFHS